MARAVAPVVAFVGIGSNLDDPARQVRAALEALTKLPSTRMLASSRLYRTPPWGVEDQPAFVNAVAQLETTLAPGALLRAMLAIERAAGRRRRVRWGPRVLDLDLLVYGAAILSRRGLEVPHPQLHLRAFVLVPLAELAPTLPIPGHGIVVELLAKVDAAGVEALG